MAVHVSGVYLAGTEVDPEPLRGIKTFVRDILPCQPHASPEGGTTPVLSDPGFEDNPSDNSHLKRKSCLVEDEFADSDESDSEYPPSSKRQRITVSAMRHLFAKFNLSDTDETSQPATLGGVSRAASAPSDGPTTPQHSPERAATPESGNMDENTVQHSSSPNQSSPITARLEKRISETDSNEQHEDKRQRMNERQDEAENQEEEETKEKEEKHKEDSDAGEAGKIVATTSEVSKNNKRQADTQESDTEDKEEPGSKVKRIRRLRRGLRLCTNITCYIEQVLYN